MSIRRPSKDLFELALNDSLRIYLALLRLYPKIRQRKGTCMVVPMDMDQSSVSPSALYAFRRHGGLASNW